jgi:hypothetical protein
MGLEVLVADLFASGVGEAVVGDALAGSIAGDALMGDLIAETASGMVGYEAATDAIAGGFLDSAATAADLIDTSANVLDTVRSVADIPSYTPFEDNFPIDAGGLPSADIPADMPISQSDLPWESNFPTSDIPINDGGLPSVTDGPMGPPDTGQPAHRHSAN